MKLQIQGQRLRFRLDEAELARLLTGEAIVDVTDFGSGVWFCRRLQLHSAPTVALDATQDEWRLHLPESAVRDYVTRLPCREALCFESARNGGAVLSLRFEVDVRDSLQMRGLPQRRRTADKG